MNDCQVTVLQPVCPDCGVDVAELARPVDLDWRDEREARLGANAHAVQTHRASVHQVIPKVGDVVVYFTPWRGLIIGNGPLRVEGVWDRDLHDFARSIGADLEVMPGTKYRLVNPSRSTDYYLPSTGDLGRPVTFEILSEYVAPVVETSLFDLLGDEWEEEQE